MASGLGLLKRLTSITMFTLNRNVFAPPLKSQRHSGQSVCSHTRTVVAVSASFLVVHGDFGCDVTSDSANCPGYEAVAVRF